MAKYELMRKYDKCEYRDKIEGETMADALVAWIRDHDRYDAVACIEVKEGGQNDAG